MDPLAHTLVGAALAKSGLEKRSRFAMTALVVGANLPDIDGVTYFVSGDLGLYFRRGWTHGIPAVLVWPFLLASGLVLLDRSLGSRAARFRALLPLSFLAVATHPALDWLNNYGLRWLMPIDGRWFYGDALFIVDPWIWLLLGGAVLLTATGERARWQLGLSALVAVPATLLVLRGTPGLLAGKAAFLTGIVAIAFLRWRGLPASENGRERLVRVAIALVTVYILGMVSLSAWAHRAVLDALTREGIPVEALMVGPTPMTPFRKDVVVATHSSYRVGSLTIWPSFRLALDSDEIPRLGESPLIEHALRDPKVRGFAQWARFPWAELEVKQDGYVVYFGDARYSRRRGEGFGTAVVDVPGDEAPVLGDR